MRIECELGGHVKGSRSLPMTPLQEDLQPEDIEKTMDSRQSE